MKMKLLENLNILDKFKDYRKDVNFYSRYYNRNEKEVVMPFLVAMGLAESVIHFNQHIFVHSNTELKKWLLDNNFYNINIDKNRKKYIRLELPFANVAVLYNPDFNIALTLVYDEQDFDDFKIIKELVNTVTNDIGEIPDKLFSNFYKILSENRKRGSS